MAAIRFVDTTIRDGHLSLWASGMTTGMMLPVAETLDGAGFDAIEVLSDGQMGKAVRDLKDDPFERIRMVAERTPNTPLRLIAGRINTFEHEPPEAFALFLDLAGAERHRGGADLRSVERICRLEAPGRRRARGRAARHPQPGLLDLAGAYRCLLRRALPPGRLARRLAALLQGPGRAADARAHRGAGSGHAGERGRHPCRVPHPLHHRARAALRRRSHRGPG